MDEDSSDSEGLELQDGSTVGRKTPCGSLVVVSQEENHLQVAAVMVVVLGAQVVVQVAAALAAPEVVAEAEVESGVMMTIQMENLMIQLSIGRQITLLNRQDIQ